MPTFLGGPLSIWRGIMNDKNKEWEKPKVDTVEKPGAKPPEPPPEKENDK